MSSLEKLFSSDRPILWPLRVITLLPPSLAIALAPVPAIAQIIPDNTLPGENSVVSPGAETGTLPEVTIDGGAQRSTVLFHSFDDFNINPGQEVRFSNPPLIEQIFSRVTGGRLSTINGLLGVDGLADLFFLNPNGVIFGPDAALDVRGSFVVTTGDRILFNDDISFSAVNPEAPPLLTITSPVGIQFGNVPGTIRVHQSMLEVPNGETLALLGGDIRVDNSADLIARDGRLNFTAVSDSGTIGLNLDAPNPRRIVQLPEGIERASITLSNNSQGLTQGNGNGAITLYGNNVTLRGSELRAGIDPDSGTVDTRGGAIVIDATGTVRLVQRAEIRNEVRENALGEGGRIVIQADRLLMRDSSEIRTTTSSFGSAGNIKIQVGQLILEEGNIPDTPSETSPDNDVRLPRPDEDNARPPRPEEDNARPLRPDGDNLLPQMNDDNPPSRSLTTQMLSASSSRNETDNPIPTTENPSSDTPRTTIASEAEAGATGSSGNIIIDASDIRLVGGVRLQIRNGAEGQTGGNIRLFRSDHPLGRADSVQLLLGAQIDNETTGANSIGGNIVIRATEVLLDDTGSLEARPGGINSAIRDEAVNATGGNVVIDAQTLTNRGGRIGTVVQGRGQGGAIRITVADTVLLTGNTESNDRNNPEFTIGLITSSVNNVREDNVFLPSARMDEGGDISIRTRHLILENGAEIRADAQREEGNGGDIAIMATDSVQLLRGETQGKVNRLATLLAQGDGQGGEIRIQTDQLRLEEGSSISAATLAGGQSGSIFIHAEDIVITGLFENPRNPPRRRRDDSGDEAPPSSSAPDSNLFRSEILTNADNRATGDSGTIEITASTIEISDRARVSASVLNVGKTGNIEIDANDLTLDNGSIRADAVEEDGGNIKLDITNILQLLNGSEITTEATRDAIGGNINIDPIAVILQGGSTISASNNNQTNNPNANGGNVDLTADFLLSFPDGSNSILAQARAGRGGNIDVNTTAIYGDFGGETLSNISASSERGIDGIVEIESPDVDPTRSLLELPPTFSDANRQIRNACAPGERGRGSFAVTGRSGLPASPLSRSSSPIVIPDLGPFGMVSSRHTELLQEAQMWEIAANGTVSLAAQASIEALLNRGRHAYGAGDYEGAIAHWVQATERLSDPSSGNSDGALVLASTLSNLALAYHHLGAWPQAEQALTASESLFSIEHLSEPLTIAPIFAQILNTKAQLSLATGNTRGAIATWHQADAAYGQAQNPDGQVQTRLHLIQALRSIGFYDQAQEQLIQVNQVLNSTAFSETAPSPEGAIARLNSGILLQQDGQFEDARQAFEDSLAIAQVLDGEALNREALDHEQIQATLTSKVLLNLGHLEYAQAQSPALSRAKAYGKRGEALQYYREAITAATTSIDRLHAQLSVIELLQDQQRQVNRRPFQLAANPPTPLWPADTGSDVGINAISLLESAQSLPANRESLYAQLHLVRLLNKAEQLETSTLGIPSSQLQAFLRRVEQQARTLGDRQALAYALGYQGQFYVQAKQWNEARVVTEQALHLSQQLLAPDISYQWHWQLGQVYVAQGERGNAIGAYTEAVKALKGIRTDLASTRADVQFTFRDSVEPLYRQLVQLLLQSDPNDAVAKVPQENLKVARTLIEDLQLAELQDYFQDPCVTTVKNIDTVDPNAAVIYPIILDDGPGDDASGPASQRLHVILSVDGQPLQYKSSGPIPSGQMKQTINDLVAAMTTPFDSQLAQTTEMLQQVYGWMMQPIAEELQQLQPDTLVFVADGPLRTLPFSALHDGKQYLVEQYNVSLSPGLRLFEPAPLDNTEISVVAGGISEALPGFTALPFVVDEVQHIVSQIPNNEVLLNDQLTSTNLATGLADSPTNVLHLATHGKFGADAANTFLLMWDKQLTMTEFSDILQRRNQTALTPIDLLVLSACETAAGDSRSILGIAGMAIKSGVRSAIAGLWPLNDQATSVFMDAFYQALAQPETTKVEAFQQAQRALMQDPRFQAPYYWSPFVLVGNWQ